MRSGLQAGMCRQSHCLLQNSRHSRRWEKRRWFHGGSLFLKHLGFSADKGKSDSMGLIPALSPHTGNGAACPLKTGSGGVQLWQLQRGGIEFPRDKATIERRSQPEPDVGSRRGCGSPGMQVHSPGPWWDGRGGSSPLTATELQSHSVTPHYQSPPITRRSVRCRWLIWETFCIIRTHTQRQTAPVEKKSNLKKNANYSSIIKVSCCC